MATSIAIDVGGTFTDIVIDDGVNIKIYKRLTIPSNPFKPLIDLFASGEINIDEVDLVIHASTLAGNLFLEGFKEYKPRILLITNRGFRDILEIGRQNRPELYKIDFRRPKPLVERSYRVGIRGRIDSEGKIIEDIDATEVREIALKYRGKVDVFVISLLNSYVNPVHESMVKEIIQGIAVDSIVVASHEVDPNHKEYERTSTTIINGLLRPIISKYISRAEEQLRGIGFKGEIYLMKSDGGIASTRYICERPETFIESGPAAGIVAVSIISRMIGIDNAIGFDMGGTTAKASILIGGRPEIVDEYEVGGGIHIGGRIRGRGYPLRIPHIDIVEVSSGGGTVAWVDPGGGLRIGPHSMGSEPGPACYNRGGAEPTITDANLYLGRLPEVLAGGEIRLDYSRAEEAIRRLADRAGLDPVEAAYGVVRLAETQMARAINLISVEKGRDVRDYVLFGFGGAGPLHVTGLMELGFREAIIPRSPGVFSSLGLLFTDFRLEYVEPVYMEIDGLSVEDIEDIYRGMEDRAIKDLSGVRCREIILNRYMRMRYKYQDHTLRIGYGGGDLEKLFNEVYISKYGYILEDTPIILETLNLEAIGVRGKLDPSRLRIDKPGGEPREEYVRPVYHGEDGWIDTPFYVRDRLGPGSSGDGPAIIIEDTSTIYIPPGFLWRVDEYGLIHISGG